VGGGGDRGPGGHNQRAAGVVRRRGRGARACSERGEGEARGERREGEGRGTDERRRREGRGRGDRRGARGERREGSDAGNTANSRRRARRHGAQRAAHVQPHAGRDFASSFVISLTQARLLRRQPRHAAAGALAGRVLRLLGDGLSCTLKLRPRRHVFGWRALHVGRRRVLVPGAYDEKTGSPSATRCRWAQASPSRRPTRSRGGHVPVSLRPGPPLLDMLPILPKHKLDAALKVRHRCASSGARPRPRPTSRASALRAAGLRAAPAPRLRAQREVRWAARTRPARSSRTSTADDSRSRRRPERRAAAPAVGPVGSHPERGAARRLRRLSARRRREAAPGRCRRAFDADRVLVQPEARREGARRPAVAFCARGGCDARCRTR